MTPLARVHDGAAPDADRVAQRTPDADRTTIALASALPDAGLPTVELTPAPARRLPTDSRTSPELARLPLPAVAERLDARLLPH